MFESEAGSPRAATAALCCLLLCLCSTVRAPAATQGPSTVGGDTVEAVRTVIGDGVVEKFQFRDGDGWLAPTALHVGRKAVWVGHRDAVSWMERGAGGWKTAGVDTVACPGGMVHSLAEDGAGGVWLRIGKEGGVCRYEPSKGSWEEFFDVHILDGEKVAVEGGRLFLTGRGGPDHEGVSVFDARTLEPDEYYHTKPIRSMFVDGDQVWIGESAGLLRIDLKKDTYKYFLPRDTNCGIATTAITGFGGGIAISTRGGYTGYMGDRMELSRDRLRVYVEDGDRWLVYGRGAEERARLAEDIRSGAVPVTRVMTRGGVCIYRGAGRKWERFGTGEGLPVEEAAAAVASGGRLFVSTGEGIVAMARGGGKFRPVHPAAGRLGGEIKQLDTDGGSLWMLANKAVYKAEIKKLMTPPE